MANQPLKNHEQGSLKWNGACGDDNKLKPQFVKLTSYTYLLLKTCNELLKWHILKQQGFHHKIDLLHHQSWLQPSKDTCLSTISFIKTETKIGYVNWGCCLPPYNGSINLLSIQKYGFLNLGHWRVPQGKIVAKNGSKPSTITMIK